MNFKFEINLTEQDYLDFNTFWMLKSHYGKKQLKSQRIMIAAIFLLFAVLTLLIEGFSLGGFLSVIPFVLACVVLELIFPWFLQKGIKNNVKALKKSGKMAYSPNSVLEFFDEIFVETTEEERTERKYTTIERVSVTDRFIYIHTNNLAAYILPIFTFDSNRQYREFLDFLGTKCDNIDTY